MSRYQIRFFILSLCVWGSASAMVWDNRFFPLYKRPYLWTGYCDSKNYTSRPGKLVVDGFFTTSWNANTANGDCVQIPKLWGEYNLREVEKSFKCVFGCDPIRTGLSGREFKWHIDGKIQAQGAALSFEKVVYDYLSLGFSYLFMRVNATHEFAFNDTDCSRLTSSEIQELDEIRRSINSRLGICGDHYCKFGSGDIDLYARLGNCWNFLYHTRTVDAALTFGALVPTGVQVDTSFPSSVPFGGNGFWGAYLAGDLNIEFKEDWTFGLLVRLSKRFQRTLCRRVPVGKEQCLYGTIVKPIQINPGPTFVFSPYLNFENLRDGFGVGVIFTLVYHWKDKFCNVSTVNCPPANVCALENKSCWAQEYFTLNVFYDFGKVKINRGTEPIIHLAWDVPTSMFSGKNVPKTHRISLGVEFNF